MKSVIIPSIIAKNQKELDKRIGKLRRYSNVFQVDVMDGKFVKNKSFDFDFKLPKKKNYEAHLMVMNPLLWIEENSNKVNMIIFHIESIHTKDIRQLIKKIRSKKRKVGIALNPKTPLSKVRPYVRFIDMVLFMTVYPGKYGAKFLPFTLNKVRELRKVNKKIQIEVDGGINDSTYLEAKNSGANRFVMGTYLQKSRDIKKSLNKIK